MPVPLIEEPLPPLKAKAELAVVEVVDDPENPPPGEPPVPADPTPEPPSPPPAPLPPPPTAVVRVSPVTAWKASDTPALSAATIAR